MKKKLLIFIPKFPAVTETFIEREIVKLVQRDRLDVSVLCVEKGKYDYDPILANRVICRKIRYIDAFSILGHFASYVLLNKKKLHSLFELTKDSGGFLARIYIFFGAVGFYLPLIKEIKPDFILAHFMSESSTIIMLISQILEVPYGISAHAKDIFEDARSAKTKASTAKFITICNRKAYDKYLEMAGKDPKSNILLRYHGLDLGKYSFTEIKVSNTEPVIFNNARLVEKKGHKYLIEASSILKQESFKHKILILAGGGKLYGKIKDLISVNGVENHVEILNEGKGVPFEEVVKYYQKADIFVFPGVDTEAGDADGIPNVLVEAAVFGLPIIATDAGSIPEFITNNKTGILVSQRNPKELAEAIKKLVADKNLATTLIENARRRTIEMFDINKNIEELENLIM